MQSLFVMVASLLPVGYQNLVFQFQDLVLPLEIEWCQCQCHVIIHLYSATFNPYFEEEKNMLVHFVVGWLVGWLVGGKET